MAHHYTISIFDTPYFIYSDCSHILAHSAMVKAEGILGFPFSTMFKRMGEIGVDVEKLRELEEAYKVIDSQVIIEDDYTKEMYGMTFLTNKEEIVCILRFYIELGLGYEIEFYDINQSSQIAINIK